MLSVPRNQSKISYSCIRGKKSRIFKLIDEGEFDYQYFDSDGDLIKSCARELIETFIDLTIISFHVKICKLTSDTSKDSSVPSSTGYIVNDSTVEDGAKTQRLHEDWNHRNSSKFLETTNTEPLTMTESVSVDRTGYREVQKSQSFLTKKQTMTDRVAMIYGYTTTLTPLERYLNKKGLMKDLPLNLISETESINFLQRLHNHGQSYGLFVPALG